jgi:large-conductance mechanosensitive channel
LEEVEKPQAMASPSYGIDVVALAVAVVLAAAIVLLAYQVVPDLTDLMMMPPPLSGTH